MVEPFAEAFTVCVVSAGICCCSANVHCVVRVSVLVEVVVKVCCEPNSRVPSALMTGKPICEKDVIGAGGGGRAWCNCFCAHIGLHLNIHPWLKVASYVSMLHA